MTGVDSRGGTCVELMIDPLFRIDFDFKGVLRFLTFALTARSWVEGRDSAGYDTYFSQCDFDSSFSRTNIIHMFGVQLRTKQMALTGSGSLVISAP